MQTQYHFHMETQASQASPTDDGGLALYSSTQWLDLTQRSVAQVKKKKYNNPTRWGNTIHSRRRIFFFPAVLNI